VLGRLDRLSADLGLREAEFREVSLRLQQVRSKLARHGDNLAQLERSQGERTRYLEFRLREIYQSGSRHTLRRLLGGADVERYWSGLRYAAYLNERDARVLAEYRRDRVALEAETRALADSGAALEASQRETDTARTNLERSRRRWSEELEVIRADREKRRTAIDELEGAANALGRLVETLERPEADPRMDMRRFEGLLEWPATGDVSAGFGTVVHPRFRTQVPHPGLDIEAGAGQNIVSVFDGRVAYAAWMRGYGLTAIVDHGGGLLSVYAHASALLVDVDQRIRRGQLIGKVGETGSLRGPYLYFELRLDGAPVDPLAWLRSR
jgi:septal ring factor EnvC (AmiA/AmiB activator)